MKIIKASVDLATWTMLMMCPTCSSEIGIEAADLGYRYSPDSRHYFCNCTLCDGYIDFHSDDLPRIVKRDAEKYRAVKTSSCWD